MDDDFINQYPSCNESGSGCTYSCRYSRKKTIPNPVSLSFSVRINYRNLQLYGIFSGYNGGEEAAKFVMNRLIYEIFEECPISMALQPHEIISQLQNKFKTVSVRYLESQTDALDKRILERLNDAAQSREIISEIDEKIRQGSTAIVILKMNNDLYILNCGRSMALAVSKKEGFAEQLNLTIHDNDDPTEIQRLAELGISSHDILNPTRAIGDLHRSYLYEENELFKDAKGPPVIPVADVQHCVIRDSWKYIVLLSDGVVQNLKEVEVDNIPEEVYANLKEDNTLTSTAQALVDAFARKHYDAFLKTQEENAFSVSSKREEMAILIVKLNNFDPNLYEGVDSAVSTYDSVNDTLDNGPIVPYIDASHVATGENFRLMENFLLKD